MAMLYYMAANIGKTERTRHGGTINSGKMRNAHIERHAEAVTANVGKTERAKYGGTINSGKTRNTRTEED